MRVNIQVRQLSTKIYDIRFELYYVIGCSNFFQHNSQLCDVSLRVGNSVTKAHRLVLASSSPYFYAMFNGECDKFFFFSLKHFLFLIDDMAEKLQSEVELHDVDLGALQLLIEYTYTGQVHITDENVQVGIHT